MTTEPKTLAFIAAEDWVDSILEIPSPASAEIPEWYKETTSYFSGNKLEMDAGSGVAKTAKLCMPMLDIISTGWIQKTWADIYIEMDPSGNFFIEHGTGPAPIGMRDIRSLGKMPVPNGYSPVAFYWNRPWGIKTPDNHSVLYTHPFYRHDLPFLSVSAVVENDVYHSPGKVAFFLREGFTGLIPKGTPMYQMIPFQKDAWVAYKEPRTEEMVTKFKQEGYTVRSVFSGGYKKNYWSKPDFSNVELDLED